MSLSRETLEDNTFRERIEREAEGTLTLLSVEEIEASRVETLGKFAADEDIWIFAYGSLIWNPIFEVAERVPARLNGHQRCFCLWALAGRGSPENMGLFLGLVEGGHCDGLALRVGAENRDRETQIVWRREMIGGTYIPSIQPLMLENGRTVRGICFLANPEHPRIQADIPHDRKIDALATAEGSLGTSRDYLFGVDEGLRSQNCEDSYITRLSADVRARLAANADR